MKADPFDGVMMAATEGPLAAKRVLVVEDEFLVGLTLCEDLARLAAQVTGPVASLDEALAALQHQQFDAALIDVNLRGEMSFPLADELRARKVPFVFVTGYGADTIPARFREVLRIAKPHDPNALPFLVGQMAQSR